MQNTPSLLNRCRQKFRQFRIRLASLGLIFRFKDFLITKDDYLWVFPVCAYDGTLSGNDLAVFEEVKNDRDIRKCVLFRNQKILVDGENVEQHQLFSKKATQILLRAGVVLIKHGVLANTLRPLNGKLRKIVCLWHGVPLKRIGCASKDFQSRLELAHRLHKDFSGVICSSEVDRIAMACAFAPLTIEQVWLTGLPRADFMVNDLSANPTKIVCEVEQLREKLAGKKLVFFCPTFRNGQENAYYNFGEVEVQRLGKWLEENGAVLGIREHMAARGSCYSKSLSALNPLDLSGNSYNHIEAIYHVANILITDYSSAYIDFILTKKPVISFAYDKWTYLNEERGLFYDFESVFPGPICETFDELLFAMQRIVRDGDFHDADHYEWVVSLFHKFSDGKNARRVVERIAYG